MNMFTHNILIEIERAKHIYKNRKQEKFIPASFATIISSNIIIIAFHLHDQMVW